jgi:hypothetical protein
LILTREYGIIAPDKFHGFDPLGFENKAWGTIETAGISAQCSDIEL